MGAGGIHIKADRIDFKIIKDGLERAVPLLTDLLDTFRLYNIPEDKNAALFPRYGHTKGFDYASAELRKVLREECQISDIEVVPYSTRHTFRDRATAAGISEAESQYIMGHVAAGSSKLHKQYGTMTPPEFMYENMIKVYQTSTWGYYED